MVNQSRPRSFHILSKPSGATCNLACSYCFFLDKEALYPKSKFRMSDEILEMYIKQLIDGHKTPQVSVAWQGGEPTLMGVDFYRKAIAYQEKYRKTGMTFENSMQTNGTLLNDEWCAFFKENNFLIGISIDGPAELHNTHRVDKGGKPTFEQVMRGLRLLQKHNVDTNILVTVNSINADYPVEIYHFLKDEANADWIQFIPVIERINEDGFALTQTGDTLASRSVRPEQYGRFLIRVFDEWIRNDVGEVFIQTFEASARKWMRMPSAGLCIFEETCGLSLAMEHNGDLYSCDHFVEPNYLLGNIKEENMLDLIVSEKQIKFGEDKRDTLPKYCRECDVRFACNGGCPKNRFTKTPSGENGLNYLCAGYKAFFYRIDRPLKALINLIRSGKPASDIMEVVKQGEADFTEAFAKAEKFDLCPCGSGMSFRQCHGWSRPKRRRGQSKPKSGPRPRVNLEDRKSLVSQE